MVSVGKPEPQVSWGVQPIMSRRVITARCICGSAATVSRMTCAASAVSTARSGHGAGAIAQ